MIFFFAESDYLNDGVNAVWIFQFLRISNNIGHPCLLSAIDGIFLKFIFS